MAALHGFNSMVRVL